MTFLALLLTVSARAMQPMPYYDPAGRQPSCYETYSATQIPLPGRTEVARRSLTGAGFDRLVLVFINAGLYAAVQAEVTTYLADLAADGYATKLVCVTGGRAQTLRTVLQVHRDSGLVGSVMIGNLPVAWYSASSYGEDYPLELFFSDLDGVFSDANGDGRYDSHTGNTAPDIWVGRIDASYLTYGSEEQITRKYFQRNHQFRLGQLPVPHRGLVYNEVDWYPHDHGMSNMLGDVTVFNDQNTTTAYHYKGRLRLGYEFVHLVSHSSPWVNTFFLSGDVPGGGSVFNFEVPPFGPCAVFYFLNACMCGRFTERDNLGNWYALAGPYGQVTIASAQLMYGVDDLSPLYQALGHDSCIGDAFLKWHRSNYPSFEATCILGDPTLKVNRTLMPGMRIAPPETRPGPALDWTVYPVDTSNFVSGRPRIGYSQGRIRLIYDSGRIVRSDNWFSSFDGSRFTRPESVAWHEYYDLFPSSCTDATGRFWVAWQSFRDYSSYEHFQVFSTYYYNNAWSTVRRVGAQAGYHDIQPALAAATGDTVWCAFQSWRNGQGDIWVSNEAGGGSWTTPVRLTTDSLDQVNPCVTVDRENHPWVFWLSQANGRQCIQGRVNRNGWQPIFMLDSSGSCGPPRASTDGAGRVWVVWHKLDGNQTRIYYSFYDGLSWNEPQAVSAGPGDEVLPDICVAADGSVWACWESSANGSWDIFVAHYADGWTTPQAVTNDLADDLDPTIGSDAAGNIWVAWASDRRNYWNIYAAMAPVSGQAEATPATPALGLKAAPNPFQDRVGFSFASARAGQRIAIYDASGRLVRELPVVGRQVTAWDGRDARGAAMPPGIYYCRVTAAGRQLVKLLKLE
jgi:hypothetical protein